MTTFISTSLVGCAGNATRWDYIALATLATFENVAQGFLHINCVIEGIMV
jgi:hypothetical protein